MSAPYSSPFETQPKSRFVPLAIGVAVIGLVGFGAYKWLGGGAPEQHQMPPAQVVVQDIKRQDIPLTFEYSGRTAGSREVEIRARVSGILQERTYVEGSEVKEGQILFKIDPASFEASRAQQQALLTQTERNWRRVDELFKQKAVSAKEYDDARAAYEQAKAAIDTAKINLNYTTVRSPITGVTSKEGLSEGSLVTADSSLLTRVTQLNPLYIEFAYPDSDAIAQRTGLSSGKLSLPADKKLRAEIHFGDGSVHEKEGIINFTDSIIDPQTGTVRARAVLDNKDGALLPGLFVRVVVKGFTQGQSVVIPDQAVMQGPQGQFVYVVTADNKAAIKPIKIGRLVDGKSKQRIIDDGLTDGDKVIVEGMIKVRPDAPVQVVEPKSAPAQADAGNDTKADSGAKE